VRLFTKCSFVGQKERDLDGEYDEILTVADFARVCVDTQEGKPVLPPSASSTLRASTGMLAANRALSLSER